MDVRDVMTDKVLSVTADTTLQQIAKILVENDISGVPVLDGEGALLGMVTESDLIAPNGSDKHKEASRESWLSHLAEGEPLSPQFLGYLDHPERVARDIMVSPVVTVSASTDLSEVARLFLSYGVKRLPVMVEGLMVGIVSRADLVRGLAQIPASPRVERTPAQQPQPAPPAVSQGEVSADGFRGMVEAFGQRKAQQRKDDLNTAADQRKLLVKDMTDRHIEDGKWQEIMTRAKLAAEAGETELLLLRFPCELCSDGGRAINAPQPDWPETLRGEAAELYLHWERDLKPKGFHLTAQVLDFPNDIPGDIGLTLIWGGASSAPGKV